MHLTNTVNGKGKVNLYHHYTLMVKTAEMYAFWIMRDVEIIRLLEQAISACLCLILSRQTSILLSFKVHATASHCSTCSKLWLKAVLTAQNVAVLTTRQPRKWVSHQLQWCMGSCIQHSSALTSWPLSPIKGIIELHERIYSKLWCY